MFDINNVRNKFPFIVKNSEYIYFDNGATSLKPESVINRINQYNSYESCNPHSQDYKLVYDINFEIEDVRKKVANFINAKTSKEIIFTSGSTHSSNIIALSYGMNNLKKEDTILTSYIEHASNVLPWFNVSNKTGANIEYIDFERDLSIDINILENKFINNPNIKIVSISYVSNVLSYIYPIKDICRIAHKYGAIVVCDCAQAVQHIKIDVQDLDVDFLFFSGHKIFGPTGIGILYGKYDLLNEMDPLFYGGGSNARFNHSKEVILKETPSKFESGTLNISGILGLGKAIDFVNEIGIDNINSYEKELNVYLLNELSKLDNVIIYNKDTKLSVISFNVKNIFAQDTASFLGKNNIFVRSGNHCAKLLHNLIGTDDTVRASLCFYNTKEEIDKFIDILKKVNVENVIGSII